ncbi:enoyl-CoA hydratase/isomerase family protein [Pseudonocardia sp. KRD-184]|uniref:Enoyl-CoA hydratase/isomerase family protein n=1 Tax=Pseudonocardia oceani TaxID=2792013 RepID=A0ABS6UI88_9PSEU|nr:enoyl-CoA hydratase-related protein [Pseudonocardia oceani]MBW0092673.1 enoyl-CoA hydratase/isomerase family protein [Pseudonocardia oceani]MBW0099818.1 enoyl-CoA hydratase/isomerase family protein [Pseudonocardia oceani]MBW0112065.1 enoyl-CoA hydratase/isomerase family protein [Pseudonocardia oceani]MBW0125270.1 enoyl-CoA hydratase/isomerase family protein [Pseudonocardia oceani]MBW0131962.1 enoyl-CoA hydratase/isomerase family protein [Pseudonocardia oceani]
MSDPVSSPAVEQDGRVLRARVARGRHGTLDGEALPVIAEALAVLDPATTGAVLLVSEGDSFCTGGDVRAFAGAQDRGGYVRSLAESFHVFLRALVEAPVPVVAAVPGWAAGAGMSIVCASDLAVGGRSTKLRPAYPGIGFSPDGGMTWTLPRIVGAGRARHILLTDRAVDAATALELGLLASVVDDGEVRAEAEHTAHRVAHGPTAALGRIKGLLGSSPDLPLAEQLAAEAAAISASAAGPEGAEGLAAFTEKRPPDFHRG